MIPAFLILFLLFIYLSFLVVRQKVSSDLRTPLNSPVSKLGVSPVPTRAQQPLGKETKSLFVPYWTLRRNAVDQSGFETLIYFGVTPTANGINRDEDGFKKLKLFAQNTSPGVEKLLTLRMIDNKINFLILDERKKQLQISQEVIQIAKEYSFNGIVLDLEVSALPFDSLINQISSFTQLLSTQVKKENLSFAMTLYGDSFYRLRPFDLKKLAASSDRIMIMAYDFSKARGNPGPNFPLLGKDEYGYDLDQMTNDFFQLIPPEKITIIFGLFGYDWKVDENGKAIATGQSISTNKVTEQMVNACIFISCSWKREVKSGEINVKYTDQNGQNHQVWFEDLESVKIKQAYFKQKGINSFSFWAYTYF